MTRTECITLGQKRYGIELNPDQPMTVFTHDLWAQLCGILMLKAGTTSIMLTQSDFDAFGRDNVVVLQEWSDQPRLRVMSRDEAESLEREYSKRR